MCDRVYMYICVNVHAFVPVIVCAWWTKHMLQMFSDTAQLTAPHSPQLSAWKPFPNQHREAELQYDSVASTSRGNTDGSQGFEVSAVCRAQREGSCVKEAQRSAQAFPESPHSKLYICKAGLYQTWQRTNKGYELTGESEVDTVLGDTVQSKQLEQRDRILELRSRLL